MIDKTICLYEKLRIYFLSVLLGVLFMLASSYLFTQTVKNGVFSKVFPKGFPMSIVNPVEQKTECSDGVCIDENLFEPEADTNFLGVAVDLLFWTVVSYGFLVGIKIIIRKKFKRKVKNE